MVKGNVNEPYQPEIDDSWEDDRQEDDGWEDEPEGDNAAVAIESEVDAGQDLFAEPDEPRPEEEDSDGEPETFDDDGTHRTFAILMFKLGNLTTIANRSSAV